jgi:hypothetical protein
MTIRLETIERLHIGLLGAASLIGALSGLAGPGSVLLGGAVMGGNFWLLRQTVGRLLTPARRGQRRAIFFLMTVKFAIFLGLLALLFWRVPLDPMGFAAGATMLPLACLIVALRAQTATTGAPAPVATDR